MKQLQPLPVGIQDFAQLREGGFLYVDKTESVHRLVTTSKAVFLSRPRRFGKSLLCSVFQNLYEGRKDLFQGLWIEDNWNWSKTHPVVRISFGTGKFQERGAFRAAAREQLRTTSLVHGVDIDGLSFDLAFGRILSELTARGPKPVVLIDEYDKPILQCLEGMRHLPGTARPVRPEPVEGWGVHGSTSSPRTELYSPRTELYSPRTETSTVRPEPVEGSSGDWSAGMLEAHEEELSVLEENREDLRAFYSCLKDAAPEFLFMTGVSRLAKASVFSELNHVKDITWAEDYATLCGITQAELELDFVPHLDAMGLRRKLTVPALLERLRSDYNGFRFAAGDDGATVYNPFSICRCLDSREFGSYWTETGTPEFLVRLMRGSNLEISDVEGRQLSISALSSLNPERPDVLPLLLQTGYLTITGWDVEDCYRLGFPNKEVRTAFVEHLLNVQHSISPRELAPRAQALAKALLRCDLEEFFEEMQHVFTGIAYQLDDGHERRYHGLFHALCILAFSGKGVVLSEVPNALGRSDLVIDLPNESWIFEMKRDTDTAKALEQMKRKRYENQWEGRLLPDGSIKPVRKVAVTFGTAARNIVSWELHSAIV